jgi:membrane protein implicated in regulation of membrane protease activity
MYLIAIAWLYVVVLAAAAEETVVGGMLTFIFYGLVPLSLVLWLFGSPARRRRRREREEAANDSADSDNRQ